MGNLFVTIEYDYRMSSCPPRRILVCRSSEIDFDAIWANLGGKIAIESPEKLSDNDLENTVDRCYLHVLYISTVLKTGTLKTPRGWGKKFASRDECPLPPPLQETLQVVTH